MDIGEDNEAQRVADKRELLHSISDKQDLPDQLKGFLPPGQVKKAVSLVMAVALVAAALSAILGIWGQIDGDTVGRVLATIAVIAFATVGLVAINEQFGGD
jgi:hypothetical protein